MSMRESCVRSAIAVCFAGAALMSSQAAFAVESSLVEAAKKEGTVVWYTTAIVDQLAVPISKAFQAKYGIKVVYVRANADQTALRVANEAAAKKVQVDVFDGTSTTPALEKIGQVMKWTPDSAKHFPKQFVDANGYWVATNLYVLTAGYNANLVKDDERPKSWEDLLAPQWRGKMAWGSTDSSSAGPGFVGLALKQYGQDKGMDLLRKLADQKIAGIGGSARQVLDQVISGEYSIGLQIFDDQAALSAAQGAPVKWYSLEPTSMAVLSVASVALQAPHPNAGKLFLDYLTSAEGQQIFRDAFYVPADPDVAPKDPTIRPDHFPAVFFTPEEIVNEMPNWGKLFRSMFQ